MNSEINKKTPAFIYAKEFKLSKVLGNLQAYKLATGNVGQTEQEEASRKHGNNLGAMYGDLITKASLENTKRKQDETDQGPAKQKKRKSQKKQNKKSGGGGEHYPVPTVRLEDIKEPLPLPECWQKDEDSSSSSGEESSEVSDSEGVDFLGLASTQTEENSSDDSCSKVDTEISTSNSRNMPNKLFHEETSSESGRVYDHNTAITTYSCARCNRRGHLTEHCTIPQTAMENCHQSSVKKNANKRSSDIQDLFLQCRKLKRSKDVSCSDCGNTSNLAFCFECRLTLCDGRGHLIEHLLNFTTHTKLFSHKLQKLLKCSNSSCNVVNISELLVCPQCLSKIFDKQYSLINATWSNRGLQAIANVLCCEEHFHWHRMNCYNSSAELLFSRENLLKLQEQRNGLLSEFFF